MRVYTGQTRGRRKIAELQAAGLGECFVRGTSYWPPRRTPWFYDNGAFGDWRAGRPFDAAAFESDLPRIRAAAVPPDFIVCPDIVAGGRESLEFSLRWLPRLRSECPGLPVYLAVQDGMEVTDMPDGFDGIFVGGTVPWKKRTGAAWASAARERGIPCHVGRCGSFRSVLWARQAGVDSIDSNVMVHTGHLRRVLSALSSPQTGMAL